MKHKILDNYYLKQTASKIANARYDSVIIFLKLLSEEFKNQSIDDEKRKRPLLSNLLLALSEILLLTVRITEKIWIICKPHM